MATVKSNRYRSSVNPIETGNKPGDSFVDELNNQAFTDLSDDFFAQLLGFEDEFGDFDQPKKGDMKHGEEITLNKRGKKEKRSAEQRLPERRMPAIDYHAEILYGSERLSKRESRQLEQRIQEIMDELNRLVSSSQKLGMQFAEVGVAAVPTGAGKYHLHFFEWMLGIVRGARMKIEDGGAWLNVLSSKKAGRKYGAMAKKHGTSFTLSNERTAATQTG